MNTPADAGDAPPASFYFLLELLYHCIRAHEEAIREKRAARPNYDASWAEQAIAAGRQLLERSMTDVEIAGAKAETVVAGWDRGLQPDTIEAVRAEFGRRLVSTGRAHELLKGLLKIFFVDREFQTEDGLSFYGGAALCLHIAQTAGIDPHGLVRELLVEAP